MPRTVRDMSGTIRIEQKAREQGGSEKPGRLRDPGTRKHRRAREIERTERPTRQGVRDPRYAHGRHGAGKVT